MTKQLQKRIAKVHCRIGSLENRCYEQQPTQHVHCRIGSLEISATTLGVSHEVVVSRLIVGGVGVLFDQRSDN